MTEYDFTRSGNLVANLLANAGLMRDTPEFIHEAEVIIADALRAAYERGHDDGVERENELWQSGKAR